MEVSKVPDGHTNSVKTRLYPGVTKRALISLSYVIQSDEN